MNEKNQNNPKTDYRTDPKMDPKRDPKMESKTDPRTAPKNVSQDPKTGSLGDHPVGVSLGAIGTGAAAGAVGGAIGGPVGAVAGAAVGAVVGGLAGGAVAEAIDPTAETKYWQENYPKRPYANKQRKFEEYEPAYRYGWESFGTQGGKGHSFSSVEADLGRGWEKARGSSHLAWDDAKPATREAWDRIESGGHARKERPDLH